MNGPNIFGLNQVQSHTQNALAHKFLKQVARCCSFWHFWDLLILCTVPEGVQNAADGLMPEELVLWAAASSQWLAVSFERNLVCSQRSCSLGLNRCSGDRTREQANRCHTHLNVYNKLTQTPTLVKHFTPQTYGFACKHTKAFAPNLANCLAAF